jgi:hypothetical protein
MSRLFDDPHSSDDQAIVVDVDLNRVTADARQVNRDQVTGLNFVNVSQGRPVAAFKLISGIGSASLCRVFKEPVHSVLQEHQILQRVPLLCHDSFSN